MASCSINLFASDRPATTLLKSSAANRAMCVREPPVTKRYVVSFGRICCSRVIESHKIGKNTCNNGNVAVPAVVQAIKKNRRYKMRVPSSPLSEAKADKYGGIHHCRNETDAVGDCSSLVATAMVDANAVLDEALLSAIAMNSTGIEAGSCDKRRYHHTYNT